MPRARFRAILGRPDRHARLLRWGLGRMTILHMPERLASLRQGTPAYWLIVKRALSLESKSLRALTLLRQRHPPSSSQKRKAPAAGCTFLWSQGGASSPPCEGAGVFLPAYLSLRQGLGPRNGVPRLWLSLVVAGGLSAGFGGAGFLAAGCVRVEQVSG